VGLFKKALTVILSQGHEKRLHFRITIQKNEKEEVSILRSANATANRTMV
jgi:hypothetical protein